nr:hypothetical protein [Tanacetum cinerariifolium]
TALSPGYVANSNSKEDPEEDLKEDATDYLVDGGDDDDDESSDEDDDVQEASEDDDEEEEEHLALTESSAILTVDHVHSARIAEYVVAPTPPSLLTPLSSLLPQIPSPPLPLPLPPTHTSLTYVEATLDYRAAEI